MPDQGSQRTKSIKSLYAQGLWFRKVVLGEVVVREAVHDCGKVLLASIAAYVKNE
jgi:hypothetical protein